ncbi:MAG: choice-of-anchor M domain-containing protein [Dermatophilaceae bacterium]
MPPPVPAVARPRLVATALAVIAVVAALSSTLAPPAAGSPTPNPSDPLQQRVEEGERAVTGARVLDSGHVDIGPKMVDGRWTLMVRDDSASPPVWRSPDDVVLHVGDEVSLPAPGGEGYEFLGVAEGTPIWVVPQTEVPGAVWVGWNTQDPAATAAMRRGATMTYTGRRGPGAFTLFLQDGAFGEPRVLWDGERPERQDVWVEANTHTHANWVFTEPGVHDIAVELHADAKDGARLTDSGVLRFAVGGRDAVTAATSRPREPVAGVGGGDTAGAADARTESASTTSRLTLLWGLGGLAVVLAVALGAVVTARRAARMRAAASADAPGVGPA